MTRPGKAHKLWKIKMNKTRHEIKSIYFILWGKYNCSQQVIAFICQLSFWLSRQPEFWSEDIQLSEKCTQILMGISRLFMFFAILISHNLCAFPGRVGMNRCLIDSHEHAVVHRNQWRKSGYLLNNNVTFWFVFPQTLSDILPYTWNIRDVAWEHSVIPLHLFKKLDSDRQIQVHLNKLECCGKVHLFQ